MEFPNCKNPPAVCGDLEGPSCHVSVPMTTFYWVEALRWHKRTTGVRSDDFNGLSLMKRELVDHCVYIKGIRQFEYSEMKKMIRCAFGALEDRIPKNDLIESNAGVLDDSGIILVHDDAGAHVTALFKKSKDGRLVIEGGFRKYVIHIQMKEDDLVVVTFHEHAGTASMTVRVCIIS
ncbi:hypothetical protein TRIUR3_07621 [Triticum urartu]|uniref:Uncharacterized protein n=1 Tax=Triticum urartu TaxID=4572 RepID=M8A023_TRIUA|nr:hypothetical protein TRIUR3_07621 [Triticum urartu]